MKMFTCVLQLRTEETISQLPFTCVLQPLPCKSLWERLVRAFFREPTRKFGSESDPW